MCLKPYASEIDGLIDDNKKNVEQENYAIYLQLMTGSEEKLYVGQPLQMSGY